MQETCPYCGGTEFALRTHDGPEELIWCANCFRVWFRPDQTRERANDRIPVTPEPTRA